MAQNDSGVTKLENGNWEYRFVMMVDGKKVTSRKRKDEDGNPLTTKRAAIKARQKLVALRQICSMLFYKLSKKRRFCHR